MRARVTGVLHGGPVDYETWWHYLHPNPCARAHPDLDAGVRHVGLARLGSEVRLQLAGLCRGWHLDLAGGVALRPVQLEHERRVLA